MRGSDDFAAIHLGKIESLDKVGSRDLGKVLDHQRRQLFRIGRVVAGADVESFLSLDLPLLPDPLVAPFTHQNFPGSFPDGGQDLVASQPDPPFGGQAIDPESLQAFQSRRKGPLDQGIVGVDESMVPREFDIIFLNQFADRLEKAHVPGLCLPPSRPSGFFRQYQVS